MRYALLATALGSVLTTPASALCLGAGPGATCFGVELFLPGGVTFYADPFANGTIAVTMPITITDTATGDTATFDMTWSAVNLAVAAAAISKDTADVGAWLDAIGAAVDLTAASSPTVTKTVYSGLNAMVSGILSGAATAVGSGSVPIGPDPTATVDFRLMDTEVSWTFDYFGSLSDPTGIHGLRDFSADYKPGASSVPEASTWALLLAGFFVTAGFVRAKNRAV